MVQQAKDEVSKVNEARGANSDDLPALIRPLEAVELLSDHYLGSKAAKDLLADCIKDGRLRAYALRTWTVIGLTPMKAWKAGPNGNVINKAQIDAGALRRSTYLPADQQRWDWVKGNFYLRGAGGKRTMFRSVRFAEPDVIKLLPSKSPRGLKSDESGRHEIWLAILDVMNSGGSDAFRIHGVAVSAVAKALRDRDPWGGTAAEKTQKVDRRGDTISKMVTDVRDHFGLI
jgi:hypothetical protein